MREHLSNRQISGFSAGLGGLIWSISLFSLGLPPLQQLFLLAPLVLVPLGLPLLTPVDRQGLSHPLFRILIKLQPFAALLLMLSFIQAPGLTAACLATGWIIFTLLCGMAGILRLLPHGLSDIGELCLDASFLFLPVGGIWLGASRLGVPLMGFQEPLVLLTAIHFHFAGFAACLLTGLSGRLALPYKPYLFSAIGVMSGIPLLAIGISFLPSLELISAIVFAGSLTILAVLWLKQLPQLKRGRVLIALSGLSVIVSMAYALTYALAEYFGQIWVSIPQMASSHGVLNAFGFALLGILAFWRIQPTTRITPPGIPFSHLASQGFVGPDFFKRIQAIPDHSAQDPTGLVDQFISFRRPGFEPLEIDPRIRHFYEYTADYQLFVSPDWQPGFRLGGKIWRKLSEKIGQMCLPIASEQRNTQITSQILPLKASIDGRPGVRAWVRTYSQTGQACYVAAYAQHQWQEQTYMNIAFALPGGNLTSVLSLESLPVKEHSYKALQLSSLFVLNKTGDQGVYLVRHPNSMRLPINETITVWCADMPGFNHQNLETDLADAPLFALHDMWLFGLHCLRLHYFIYPLQPSSVQSKSSLNQP